MKTLRLLAYPFAILYGWITGLRNLLYDNGILESRDYKIPLVCVGNLSVGGTGKSPMIEYLISFLKDTYRVAVLSRGYKRETSGYLEVLPTHKTSEVGDEPLQFKKKFPEILVAVCADRRKGIELLKGKADIILLDDALQHRKVKAAVNILLTPYHDLFIDDFMLPTGNLREPRSGSKRAHCLVVTKCPERVPYAKLQEIELRMPIYNHQKLYFSKIGYGEKIFNRTEAQDISYLKDKPFTLVTGIADPTPLCSFLNAKGFTFTHQKFPDHHNFKSTEIVNLKRQELILTTEKDFMRLQSSLDKFAMYYLPITTEIIKDQGKFFEEFIIKSIDKKRLG